jgi:hypothetical protein
VDADPEEIDFGQGTINPTEGRNWISDMKKTFYAYWKSFYDTVTKPQNYTNE